MEVGVQRTDPIQRIQTNGPRVSFNRDVHVKRIGSRISEGANFPVQKTNLQPPQNSKPSLRRELPADLSDESILKEAALVLAQAEGVNCTVAGGSEIVGGRLNEKSRGRIQRRDSSTLNKFHSLPTRRSKSSKPVARSVSDASSKKTKKPSIFSIFSRKSEPNLDELSIKSINGKRVTRSKSDVGSSQKHYKINGKPDINEIEEAEENFTKTTQLSPIIEITQHEDYFEKQQTFNNLKPEKTEKVESSKTAGDIGELIVKNSAFHSLQKVTGDDIRTVQDRGFGSLPRTTKKSLNYQPLFHIQSKSLEDMHCSQLPPEKLPLTKGVTVDGLVKRLSMERFSPTPHLSSPGFSYIRPSIEQQVIYAQVLCDDNQENYAKKGPMDFGDDAESKLIGSFNHTVTTQLGVFPSQEKCASHLGESRVENRNRSHTPQSIKTHNTGSPQVKRQSRRSLSDEDEGLGFEDKKQFQKDNLDKASKITSHSIYDYKRRSPSEEPPIVPVIRNLSPVGVGLNVADRGRADGMDSKRRETPFEPHKEFCDLSYRRAALESKIRCRRFGSVVPESGRNSEQDDIFLKEKDVDWSQEPRTSPNHYREERQDRVLSPIRDDIPKYHKLNNSEIFHKYSPERTHLDMISPVKEAATSSYIHNKILIDEHRGIRGSYKREVYLDELGLPHNREVRRREIFTSPKWPRETELIEESNGHEKNEVKGFAYVYREDAHLSPENQKSNNWQEDNSEESLKRNMHLQRNFDIGDSGIENDFRKESFIGDLNSKWRKRTVEDDIYECELFLRKERHHVEELHRKWYDFVYRERSIDDGSHFDPRIDKYPKGTLRKSKETNRYSSPNRETGGTLKREKKKGSLEKVKKLFLGSSKKNELKETIGDKIIKVDGKLNDPLKMRYMVREEEMRQRYHEYKPQIPETTITNIASRRRLSTPKASPLLKRTSSEKSRKPSPLAMRDDSTMTKAEKSGWFKSIDRRSKKKSSEKEPPSKNFDSPSRTPTNSTMQDGFSTLRVKKSYRTVETSPSPQAPEKNLRFFGDTDLDSVPSFSRAASATRSRPSVIALSRNQKHSQSAYHLDRMIKSTKKAQPRSSSLQNLDNGFDEIDRPRRRQHSRSRELDNISESDSEPSKRNHIPQLIAPRVSSSRDRRRAHHNDYDRDLNERESPSQRAGSSELARIEFRKPPPGPPKPSRSIDKRTNLLRERERFHDSSGTEGDSSLQSQRSVVYLHATTVGAIPQPYFLNSRRRTMSREELSALKKKEKNQPMTRTVSRSVSMLAPWKPKHLHEGYEINYSQEPAEKLQKSHTMPKKTEYQSSNNKSKQTSSNTMRRLKTNGSPSDDISSTLPSSLISTSKSGVSSDKKSQSDVRQNTQSRRKVK